MNKGFDSIHLMEKCIFVFLITLLLLLSSCQDEDKTQDGMTTESEVEAPRTELSLQTPEGDAQETAGTDGGDTEPKTSRENSSIVSRETPGRNPELLPISNQDKLALRKGAPPVSPEDMEIGMVFSERAVPPDESESHLIAGVTLGFLNSLVAGKIDGGAFDMDSKGYLERILAPLSRNDEYPVSFRFGIPSVDEEGAGRVNVRLFGETGRASGEIFLVKKSENWTVSDIQIDFDELLDEYQKKYEQFEPKIYRWLELY